jgi:uncharacterized protein
VRDLLRYDKMVEAALRGVMREALARAAAQGLPGQHHFYINFRTDFPGLAIPDHLARQYPQEMTVVLQHEFWDLEVTEQGFSVTLSFASQLERLTIPFDAITAFADPAVKFALQFQPVAPDAEAAKAPSPDLAGAKEEKPAEVVALDTFRKK